MESETPDFSWGDLPLAERNATCQDLKADVIPAAWSMLAVGAVLLVALVVQRRTSGLAAWIVPAIALAAMMVGYGSILAVADWLWSCTAL